MKKIISSITLILLLVIVSLIIIFSTIGYETDRFNEIISKKISKNNQNFALKIKKIRFKFDIKKLSLFLDTSNPKLSYQDLDVPIEKIKVYLNFISLIGSNAKIEKVDIKTKEINIEKLKKILFKMKPSSLSSLINNKVKNGKLVTDLQIFFNNDLKIDNFIAKGEVKKMYAIVNKNLILQDTSFNFFADNSDILIKKIRGKMKGLQLIDGSLQVQKDKNIKINTEFVTNLSIDKKNIDNFLPFFKNIEHVNKKTIFEAKVSHNLNLTFDSTFKLINYKYKNNGKIEQATLKTDDPIKNILFDQDIKNFSIKDSTFEISYGSNKKNYIYSSGNYRFNDYEYQSYDFKNNISGNASNIEADFDFNEKLIINFINYNKEKNKIAKISTNIKFKKNSIFINEINYVENKNFISINDLAINKNNIISFKKIKIKTFEGNNLKNDLIIDFQKKIIVTGNKYDATNLNKILNKKTKNNILKKINKNIIIDLKNVETPLSKKLANFKLIGNIKRGKFEKISSKGDFGNNKFLDITLKSDEKNKKKYLEIYSDLPQPLLSDYSFFRGLSEGTLIYSSTIEESSYTSNLVIENFKIINAPGVVKLLSLADFGGLADLAEGDGLSFKKLEIKMINENGLTKLEELYAVGPSISVLMDGYRDQKGLTSLRGTLVPAKNLNKLISKIPLIGDIIIPKEIGEGLFGVSFKMKGPPGNVKTTINPIKTLTPRFITKALERSKKTK